MNYFNYSDNSSYPIQDLYSPEEKYPEYPGENQGSGDKNDVYRMIREIFVNLGLDRENIGTSNWNPLGRYIDSGNTVLLKPNWVKHANPAEENMKKGMDCLITHPSVVRCIFDYVYIALKGKGKIIIADAIVFPSNFAQNNLHFPFMSSKKFSKYSLLKK